MTEAARPRQIAAPPLAVLVSVGLLVALRGLGHDGGLILRPDFLLRDGLALLAAAALAGVVAAAVAGDHVPGAPARALAGSWVALGLLASTDPAPSRPVPEELWPMAVLFESLLLACAALVNTTACWLVDTRINFPRLYPDPADRPPGKHTSSSDLRRLLLPHASLVMLGTAGSVGAVELLFGIHRFGAPLAVLPVGIWVYGVQRLRPARGSLWTMLGVIAGHGLALAALPVPGGGATPMILGVGLLAWTAGFARILPSR